jgi:carbon monoxide dehydrogenase subunit G
VRYRKTHRFNATPDRIWRLVEEPQHFPRMWPWMKEPELTGGRVAPGARLRFVIDPPFPYRMQVDATFTEVVEPERVEAALTGDLEGTASISFTGDERETLADVSWEVEMKHRGMRVAARVARPVLMRAHDWAVRVALRGFRKKLASGD